MKKQKYDFSGYATKNNLKCSDGRVIRKDAFKHCDGVKVPLVWHHMHDDPTNVLGHAILENRDDGVYSFCTFNDSKMGQSAKELVKHEDIVALSIYANQLKQDGNNVMHGFIREVSLVLSGANPGAKIDNINFAHADGGIGISEEDAIITTGETLVFGQEREEDIEHAEEDTKQVTIEETYNAMTPEQKDVVHALIAVAVSEDSDDDDDDSDESLKQGDDMKNGKKNVFDKSTYEEGTALTHAETRALIADAVKCGSMKAAVMAHAGTYGIDNISVLFPDAKAVSGPEFDKRRSEWVSKVISTIGKRPFAKIKSSYATITAAEARAKGYITGAEKFEEVFPMLSRTTEPTTIYKKQKLDRDDILDITDLDVVAWLKAEMRLMLDEEIARVILIGDGREITDADKVDESKIRPIYTDAAIYTHRLQVPSDATIIAEMEAIIRAKKNYKGSGSPTYYTTADKIADYRLVKDKNDNYMFRNVGEVASFLGVKELVEVEVMEGTSRTVAEVEYDLNGIIVNLRDYTSGSNKGGAVNMFDDFDIDFNQYKYLMETRLSGALTKIRSAIVVEKIVAAG